MVDSETSRDAQAGYKHSRLAGLDGPQLLKRGLHGVVVHLVRAQMAADHRGDPEALQRRAQAAASADRLLVCLARLADVRTELGVQLVACYTGLQRLIREALSDTGDNARDRLAQAVVRARTLEHVLGTASTEASHD